MAIAEGECRAGWQRGCGVVPMAREFTTVTFGCCWEPQGTAVSQVGLFICVPVDTSYNHLWGN